MYKKLPNSSKPHEHSVKIFLGQFIIIIIIIIFMSAN